LIKRALNDAKETAVTRGKVVDLQMIEKAYKEKTKGWASGRANLLAQDTVSNVWNGSQYTAAAVLNPVAKKWLMTESKVPRPIHLEQVGQVVPFNDRFSPSGDYWSGERVGCKCGIEVIYGALENGR